MSKFYDLCDTCVFRQQGPEECICMRYPPVWVSWNQTDPIYPTVTSGDGCGEWKSKKTKAKKGLKK